MTKSTTPGGPVQARVVGTITGRAVLFAALAAPFVWTITIAASVDAQERTTPGQNLSSEVHTGLTNGIHQPDDRLPHGESDPSETYSDLLSYVQQLADDRSGVAGAAPSPHSFTPIEDQAYSALRSFVREIGGDNAQPEQPRLRLAEAPAPGPKGAKAAKAKAVKTEPAVVEDEAHPVGSQVCMTCHAAQAARFAQTVMGKIGKVRKGTMECENCHGPGSLHVKAGGGRGVGGMISFRNDDPTRTPEEK